MKIELDNVGPVKRLHLNQDLAKFIKGLDKKNKFVSYELVGKLAVYHNNYLSYLEEAWNNHLGVILTPDIIWNLLLTQLTEIVAENSEKYESLFTKVPGIKTDIIVDQTDEPYILPLQSVINLLKGLVPTNTDTFLPNFSTTDEYSELANYAAFCDMVSPYYNYCIKMCGIPWIDVLGTGDDWIKLKACWDEIAKLFVCEADYFNLVSGHLGRILHSKTNIWLEMFIPEKCGSGSQYEIGGWITELFYKKPSLKLVENYSSCISTVKYKYLPTNQNFVMYSGLLSSQFDAEGQYLYPYFGRVFYEQVTDTKAKD